MSLCISVFAQGGGKTEGTHGTINIALANANGLVLETDSMLSSPNGYPVLQAGRKLYQADDHTGYMVASFFSDPGPRLPSGKYPANIVIQSLTLHYIHNKSPNQTISQQLDEFGAYVAFELGFLAKMHRAVDHFDPCPPGVCLSMITIAGYENGRPVIGHIDVISTTKDMVGFVSTNKAIDIVQDRLIYRVYAVKDVALQVLDHPERISSGDPVLHEYRNSMKRDAGRSMTISQMQSLASRLEQMTSKTYPRIVGGTEEVAVFRNGHVHSFHSLSSNEYEMTGDEYTRVMIGFVNEFGDTGSCADGADQPRGVGVYIPQNAAGIVLLNKGDLKCVLQSIDKMVVTRTRFDSCVLWYRGDPNSYFGDNNIVINSTLSVDPRVSLKSPYIQQFKKNYPDVKIEGGKDE